DIQAAGIALQRSVAVGVVPELTDQAERVPTENETIKLVILVLDDVLVRLLLLEQIAYLVVAIQADRVAGQNLTLTPVEAVVFPPCTVQAGVNLRDKVAHRVVVEDGLLVLRVVAANSTIQSVIFAAANLI